MASLFLFLLLLLSSNGLAYRPGDIVPMSKMGQYHSVRIGIPLCVHFTNRNSDPIFFPTHSWWLGFSICLFILGSIWLFQSRTAWQDVIGRHCPIFGVNREVRTF